MPRQGSGFFVAIEGPDGSGKTTLAKRLVDVLRDSVGAHFPPTTLVRMPGELPIGEQLRAILLKPLATRLDPVTELLLMLADRSETVRKVIQPTLSLRAGYVVCDRYNISSYVYQGYIGDVSIETIHKAVEIATCGLEPDLYIVLDVDEETQRQRLELRRGETDRFEAESKRKVAEGYRAITNLLFRGACVIDTSKMTPDEVFQAARQRISGALMRPI